MDFSEIECLLKGNELSMSWDVVGFLDWFDVQRPRYKPESFSYALIELDFGNGGYKEAIEY